VKAEAKPTLKLLSFEERRCFSKGPLIM